MRTKLGRAVILVDNYDEALQFYKEMFGCKVLFDHTTDRRYLHIAFSDDANIGVWLLKDESESKERRVGKQTNGQPVLVIYTNDIEALYSHVSRKGVNILTTLSAKGGSRFFHCEDLYGNKLTIVQLHEPGIRDFTNAMRYS